MTGTDVAEATSTRERLLRQALWLAVFTVVRNLAEGAIAIAAAASSESRALVGFGVDSFVESASATVLIWRLKIEQRVVFLIREGLETRRAEHLDECC